MSRTRKHISRETKLAAVLLMLVRPDENGVMVPCIPLQRARSMTPKQIIAHFDFDHAIPHSLDGPDTPWNLTPRLRVDHKAKTKKDVREIAKVKRGVKKRRKKAYAAELEYREKAKAKALPGSRGSKWKRKLNGKVELRCANSTL